jgi:hypothetical protein
MTIRERLADWISGGRYDDGWRVAKSACKMLTIIHGLVGDREKALRRIAAMETTNANATVRRMAKIAREALEQP